jgi:hypothetical protein
VKIAEIGKVAQKIILYLKKFSAIINLWLFKAQMYLAYIPLVSQKNPFR